MPRTTPSHFRLLESLWREPIERTVFPNGVTLILKADSSAKLASIQVWVRTGSIHEAGRLGAGLSHYIEHLLFKGTSRRAGHDISAEVHALGGYINAYTTFDRTVYHVDLPSEHTAAAVDLLADMALASTLPAAEVAKEKEVILREIAMTKDDPDDRLWDGLFATAFREHPCRLPVIGHREIFSAVTRDDLWAYYRARYAPDNLVVVIVGHVDPAAARDAVGRHFGGAPRTAVAPVLVPGEPEQLAPREMHRFEDVDVSRAVTAWKVPGLAHADAPVLELLAMILGRGDSSVLWQELREKAGLVHSIEASCWNPGTVGLFCVAYTCDGAKRARAAAALERLLERLKARGLAAAQIGKAVCQLVAGEVALRQTMGGQAARIGAAEVVVGDLDFSRGYFERVCAVGPADLRRVMREYLVPARRTSVSINPAASAPATAAGARPAAKAPEFSDVRLSGGARLLLQPDRRLPNLHLRLLVQGGPHYEETAKRGATALLATVMAKDTRRRGAAEVARYIEGVGGSFHSFCGNNSLGLAAEVLPPDADRALEVVADAVLDPAFKAETVSLEREAQLAELRQDADDVVVYARKLLRRKFFGSHPLALDAQGDEAGVAALARGDLAALHRRLFVASNVVLAVAGDFDPKKWTGAFKAFLARLPRGSVPRPDRSHIPECVGDFVEARPREQAIAMQAFPGPRLDADDYYAGEVADELFSGMASRLFERVREEKALAYFVRSSRVTGLDAAMFCFFAGTQPGREAEVLAEIDGEIARVQSGGVEPAELDSCRARLKAARRQSLQANGARAMQAGLNVLQGRPVNDWMNYDARIDAVGAVDLSRFANRYLQRSLRTQLVVRP